MKCMDTKRFIEWRGQKYKRYEFTLKRGEDDKLIEHLDKKESVNAYIKDLIEKDMKKKKGS